MLVNIPLVVVTLFAASLSSVGRAGRSTVHRSTTGTHVKASSWISSAAAAIVTAVVCLLLLRTSSWGTGWQTWAILAIGLVAAGATWAMVAWTGFDLVPIRVIKDRDVVAATVRGTVFMGAFGTVYYLLSLDLQTIREISPLLSGIALIPASIGGIIGSTLANRLLRNRTARQVSSGAMIAGGAGLAGLALAVGAPVPILLVVLAISSVAQGVAYASIFALAGNSVPQADQGSATGLAGTGQQVGSAIGLAIAALCVQATADGSAPQWGISLALAIGAVAVLFSGLAGRDGSKLSH